MGSFILQFAVKKVLSKQEPNLRASEVIRKTFSSLPYSVMYMTDTCIHTAVHTWIWERRSPFI